MKTVSGLGENSRDMAAFISSGGARLSVQQAVRMQSCCRLRRVVNGGLRMGVDSKLQDEVAVKSMSEGNAAKVSKATDYYKPLVAGDILESTNEQRAIVGIAYVSLALLASKGVYLLGETEGSALGALAAFLIGFEFADFGSGVYHWAMDNYGSKSTPVFGTQIEAFQVRRSFECIQNIFDGIPVRMCGFPS
jgi:hypothetical protein